MKDRGYGALLKALGGPQEYAFEQGFEMPENRNRMRENAFFFGEEKPKFDLNRNRLVADQFFNFGSPRVGFGPELGGG